MNTIGVLTSGGDAPGMNAAIRSVVRSAKFYNLRALGIRRGFSGLLHGDFFEFNARDVSDILQRGGTVLQTARSTEFATPEGVKKAVEQAKYFHLDGLVVIGGDGSFRGVRDLAASGLPTIGIPGTIDNDISCTEYTIGFDTAINTAKDAVDKIRDTASSHQRCNIIEVMGRNSGKIAIHVAIATGAEAVYVPEMKPENTPDIVSVINDGIRRNKKHFIIVLAEGVGGADELKRRIEQETKIETKINTLGYMQRGGSPTAMDRCLASQMGARAVDLLRNGIGNRIVGMKDNKIYDIDVNEGLSVAPDDSEELIKLALQLSI
ncbi:MAG: 6-phosphofructokinase [Clostridiales bacterium]|jgi:6-phosphofructokinase 1|nr:6-phosphofructokinase [Clostridiales bacterium]